MATDLEEFITTLRWFVEGGDGGGDDHEWEFQGKELVAYPTPDGPPVLEPLDEYRCRRCGNRRFIHPDAAFPI